MMLLLTAELRAKLPPLYAQEAVPDPVVPVKFFTPDSAWTWYAIEFDGDDLFFEYVVGMESELGYFTCMSWRAPEDRLACPSSATCTGTPKRACPRSEAATGRPFKSAALTRSPLPSRGGLSICM